MTRTSIQKTRTIDGSLVVELGQNTSPLLVKVVDNKKVEGITALRSQDLPRLGQNARGYFEANFEKQMLMDRFQQSILEETP